LLKGGGKIKNTAQPIVAAGIPFIKTYILKGDSDMTLLSSKESELRILGLKPLYFFIIAAVIIFAGFFGLVPKNLVGGFALTLAWGAVFNLLGSHIPIINTYLGGGPVVVLFGMAALNYFKLLPETVVTTMSVFTADYGFIDFYIAALIAGSILGMNSKTLVKAGIRYFIPILAGVAAAFLLCGFAGVIMGYGFGKAILMVAAPIMGGGVGAGAIPMSEIYAKIAGGQASDYLSTLVPATQIGNALAILCAALLNKLGKAMPKLSGEGKLMEGMEVEAENAPSSSGFNVNDFGTGLFIAVGFFILGRIEGKFISALHPYALMIISVILVKVFRLLPEDVEAAAGKWYRFVTVNFTIALLAGCGIAYIDLGQVISALTPAYFVLCAITIIGAVIGAGFMGRLVGFYFVESSLTAGLCMANSGGTGDVATLGACNRMNLMAFGAISSRIGGAIILIIMSLLGRFLL
jgi:Na+/citrate or Na+/malate symporter